MANDELKKISTNDFFWVIKLALNDRAILFNVQ